MIQITIQKRMPRVYTTVHCHCVIAIYSHLFRFFSSLRYLCLTFSTWSILLMSVLIFPSMLWHASSFSHIKHNNHTISVTISFSQGETWQKFRSKVNQIMMQPKSTKLYVGPIDSVASDFLKR